MEVNYWSFRVPSRRSKRGCGEMSKKCNVIISHSILDWVISHVQMEALTDQIANYLKDWYAGEKQPTFNQVETVSKATGIPFGYFFLSDPPIEDLSLIEYRTVDSLELENPSRNLIDTIHDMSLRQDWMRNHLVSQGESPLNYVGKFKNNSAKNLTGEVRTILNLSEDWFLDSKNTSQSFNRIRRAISDAGTMVMMNGVVGSNTHRPLSVDEFRAFTLVDEYSPLIFVNNSDSINGKLFSLLHEFSHVLIGENSLFNEQYNNDTKVNNLETTCNAVAAEVLAPQEYFIDMWKQTIRKTPANEVIVELANHFHCGTMVIARKALDNKFIEYKEYTEAAELAKRLYKENRLKRKNSTGGDYYNTAASRLDPHFFSQLVSSVNEGTTLYTDAFHLSDTNRTTFFNLVGKVGEK